MLSILEWDHLNQKKRFDVFANAEEAAAIVAHSLSFPMDHFDAPHIEIDLYYFDFHVIYETKNNVFPYCYLVLSFHHGYIVDQFVSTTP